MLKTSINTPVRIARSTVHVLGFNLTLAEDVAVAPVSFAVMPGCLVRKKQKRTCYSSSNTASHIIVCALTATLRKNDKWSLCPVDASRLLREAPESDNGNKHLPIIVKIRSLSRHGWRARVPMLSNIISGCENVPRTGNVKCFQKRQQTTRVLSLPSSWLLALKIHTKWGEQN